MGELGAGAALGLVVGYLLGRFRRRRGRFRVVVVEYGDDEPPAP